MKKFSIALIHIYPIVSSKSLQRNVFRPSNFQVHRFKNYLSVPRRYLILLYTLEINVQWRILFNLLQFYACRGDSCSTFSLLLFTFRRDSSFCIAAFSELLANHLLISIEKFIFRYHSRASTHSANNTATCDISIAH